MSKFLTNVKDNMVLHLNSLKLEREALVKAPDRLTELDALIAEGEAEIAALDVRIPKEEAPVVIEEQERE